MNFFAGLWLVILYCQDKMPALFMDLIHEQGGVPIASIVTVLPLISSSFNNLGIAVISLVFESMGSCARINPAQHPADR